MWNNYKIEKKDRYYRVYLLDVNEKDKVTSKMWVCFKDSELTEKQKAFIENISNYDLKTALKAAFDVIHYQFTKGELRK